LNNGKGTKQITALVIPMACLRFFQVEARLKEGKALGSE
jgi:hypothetical protein